MNTLYNLGGSLGYVGFLAWTLLIGALFFSLTLLKTPRRRLVAVVIIVGLFAAVPLRKASEVKQQVDRYRAYYDASAAMYQERCRTQAGYKIHKVVEDVDGILLKVRHRVAEYDPMAPGAAFALEAYDDSYISSFLSYRYPSSGVSDGSYFANTDKMADAIPGFRYVDVIDEKDGQRYRVTGSQKVTGKKDTTAFNVKREMAANPNYDLNVYNWVLDRALVTDPAPRYAVTFEDHVIPEERQNGIASSTVKVIDTQTNDVLAEMWRYTWMPGVASAGNPSPWLTADKCPGFGHGGSHSTRQFVDHVLVARGATLPPPLK